MSRRQSFSATAAVRVAAVAITLLIAVACSRDAKTAADSSSSLAGKVVPYDVARFSQGDFANLRWLEGDWRGQIPQGGYFYERYRFVDDSTIAMRGFEDSTFTLPNDSATIVLRDGIVTDRGPKAQWSATRLDANGIEFAPVRGASNYFSWRRQSTDRWTAAIRPAKGDSTVYRMERLRQR